MMRATENQSGNRCNRHETAVLLSYRTLERRLGMEMISRVLKHRNLDVTRRYIDTNREVLDEATKKLFRLNEMYATIAGKRL